MKKLFLLLALFGVLAVGCEELFPTASTPDAKNGPSIAAIEEQMAAIGASIPKLQNTAAKANALVSEQESATRGNNGVKDMIAELEERIAALEEYIAGGGEGSWTDTTYATLEMYEQTIALLAELQAEVEALKKQGNTECGDVLAAIEQSVASMKSWVNELLTGYYDIATVDAMFAKLLEELTAEDDAIREEVEAIREELGEQFDAMDKAYRDAIREAIEENSGKLSEQLTKDIEAVNSRIDDEVEMLNKRLDDIEDRLSKLEGSVADLLKRIQSITYIPLYDDNTARVLCPNEGLEGSTVQLDFTISPRDAADDLAAVWQEAISVGAFYTGSPIMTELPVVSCTAYASQGLLTVVAACDDLSWEFYNEDVKARAIMYISDGNNELTSEYIPIIPQRSQIPNNQIWYTVTGKTPVDIQQGYGPKIVSNVYDQSKELYVVTFEEAIYSIPTDYFGGKSELKSVTLPNSVSSLDYYAFSGCHNLSDISLGKSLGYIGSRVFEGCAIHTLSLPASLYGVASDAFAGSSIAQFVGEKVADDSISLVLDNTLVAIAPAGIGAEYSVPAEAEAIGYGVFEDFNSFERFSGKFATENGYALVCDGRLVVFAKACGVEEYTIPANVTSIENRVFANCTNISLFRFESTTPPTLGMGVFDGIENLQISVPVEVMEAYLTCDWPYEYRRAIIELGDNSNIPNSYRLYYTTNNNQKLNIYPEDGYSVLSHSYTDGMGTVVFINPPTTIRDKAFMDCKSLTSITIPNSVTTIGDYAFYYCRNLTSITIPDSVTEIGLSAFNGCGSLTSLYITDLAAWCNISFQGSASNPLGYAASYDYTEGNLYLNNELVTDLIIPDSVTTIGKSAFVGCCSLTSVTIPDSVMSIGPAAFSHCSSLTSLTIPDSVTTIGGGAFYDCNSLTSVTIPNSVTTIGEDAFLDCGSLTSVTIPDSVTSIGGYAFGNCSSLMSVTLNSATPPVLGGDVFSDRHIGCVFKVLESAYNNYLSEPTWTRYAHLLRYEGIARPSESYAIGDLTTINGVKGVVFYASEDIVYVMSVKQNSKYYIYWGPDYVTTNATDYTYGMYNSNIIKSIDGWEENYPAFKWCADLGENWYLPALNELHAIYEAMNVLNEILSANGYTTLSGSYWSSTEHEYESGAYWLNFSDGDWDFSYKDNSNSVRAVVAF